MDYITSGSLLKMAGRYVMMHRAPLYGKLTIVSDLTTTLNRLKIIRLNIFSERFSFVDGVINFPDSISLQKEESNYEQTSKRW
jgi:hypothetical protein